jgi:hypothetical protein
MPRTIEVSDQNYDWLKRLAVPFEDTPDSVLDRIRVSMPQKGSQAMVVQEPKQPAPAKADAAHSQERVKLNAKRLRDLGVDHFEVGGHIGEWSGKRAHPRAYLDAVLDQGLRNFRYYERHAPSGDAASRVILKVGAEDTQSLVWLSSGSQMKISEFVAAVLNGAL